jgi:hypothetical protein
MLPSSGEGILTPTLLGPFERANSNHWNRHNPFESSRKSESLGLFVTYVEQNENRRMESSGMLRRVALVITDVSEELSATSSG